MRHLLILAMTVLAGCELVPERPDPTLPNVSAVIETEPVPSRDDAADDPAIWVHPERPLESLIVATDKRSGLLVYNLDGRELLHEPVGRVNNVDVRQGVELSGRRVDLVAASHRDHNAIVAYALHTNPLRLEPIGAPLAVDLEEAYGFCLSVGPEGQAYGFANDKLGRIVQVDLATGAEVRRLSVPSQAEGCVVDDARQVLYVGEEEGGIWAFRAAADGPTTARLVVDIDSGRLVGDVEGLALYADSERNWLLASSQGAHRFDVFDRARGHLHLGSFQIAPAANGPDGAQETDGIEVTSLPLGEAFPRGLLVVQDGFNRPGRQAQNFKLVSMADVLELFVDERP